MKTLIKILRYSWILAVLVCYFSSAWLFICLDTQRSLADFDLLPAGESASGKSSRPALLNFTEHADRYIGVFAVFFVCGGFCHFVKLKGHEASEKILEKILAGKKRRKKDWVNRCVAFTPVLVQWLIHAAALIGGPILSAYIGSKVKINHFSTVLLGVICVNSMCVIACYFTELALVDIIVAVAIGLLMANKGYWKTGDNNYFAMVMIAAGPVLSMKLKPIFRFLDEWASTNHRFAVFFDLRFKVPSREANIILGNKGKKDRMEKGLKSASAPNFYVSKIA